MGLWACFKPYYFNTTEATIMTKNFWFQDYFVIMEKQGNGSVRVVASNDDDTDYIREVFYDYPASYIVSKIKSDIRFRLAARA